MKIYNKFVESKNEPSNKNDIWFDGSTVRLYKEGEWYTVTLSKEAIERLLQYAENVDIFKYVNELPDVGDFTFIYFKKEESNGNLIVLPYVYDGEWKQITNTEIFSESSPFGFGEVENSAVLKGGNNQVISEGSVALGKDNISGLKGWYYKAVQIGNDGNVVYLYLTTEQQIPVLVSTANAVENQEKDININISKGDICSIINGNRLIDCFEFRLNEISNYGRISFTYKGEGTNPLSTIQNVEELKLEDYSVFCISKPSYGIVELSKCNIALGNNTKSLAESSVSIGLRSTAAGITTYAEGQDTIAVGECAHAEGAFTKANGIASHTEGFGTQTEELSAHAEGYNTLATGGASHAEGSATKATGLHSHAEGDTTEASGAHSHAEGQSTRAGGINSHAEGYRTEASGDYSHAEGDKTLAGDYSHAEGHETIAGNCSHAEGYRSEATGYYSHAEGDDTRAKGYYSHTEGENTIAYNHAEHASGKYNLSIQSIVKSQATQFSIGIGTSESDRKNAFEVKQNGDIYIEGVEGRIQDRLNTNIDSALSDTSTNPVQNKAIVAALATKTNENDVKELIALEHIYFLYKADENKLYFKGLDALDNWRLVLPYILNITFGKPLTPHLSIATNDGTINISTNDFEINVSMGEYNMTWSYNGKKFSLVFDESGSGEQIITSQDIDYVTTQQLTELSAEVSGLSKKIDNLPSAESEVFVAEYGKATYAEVVEAISAGKAVICKYNNNTQIGYLVSYSSNNAVFHSYSGVMTWIFTCYANGSWIFSTSNTRHELKTLDNGNAQITIAGKTAEVATPQYVENLLGVIINGDY